MPYNAKTYNLEANYELGIVLETVVEAFSKVEADPDVGISIERESWGSMISFVHDLNRYRKAYRVQRYDDRETINSFDSLIVSGLKKREDGPPWTVTIRERKPLSITFVDVKSGKPILRMKGNE